MHMRTCTIGGKLKHREVSRGPCKGVGWSGIQVSWTFIHTHTHLPAGTGERGEKGRLAGRQVACGSTRHGHTPTSCNSSCAPGASACTCSGTCLRGCVTWWWKGREVGSGGRGTAGMLGAVGASNGTSWRTKAPSPANPSSKPTAPQPPQRGTPASHAPATVQQCSAHAPVSWPTCENVYWRPSASWYASTLPSRNCTLASTTSLVRRRICGRKNM